MRTLNRPMFNMGGPIKQGVMHGIREPYKHGGPTGTGLVGDQRYPKTGGREHHLLPLAPILAGIARFAAPAFGRFVTSQLPRMTRLKTLGKGKNLRFARTKKQPKTFQPETKRVRGKLRPSGKSIKNIMDKEEFVPYSFWAKDPLYKAAVGSKGIAGKAIRGTGRLIKGAATTPTGLLSTGLTAAYFWPDGTKKTTEELIEDNVIRKGDKDYGPHTKGAPTMTASMIDAKDKADKEKRINALLDTMGYDKARKNAAYDALIDAGRMVSERGTLDPKNIGRELIDPIVASASQRFDKPEQIREAVGLMQVKADIQKEMEDPQVKALRALEIEKGEKALAGDTLEETITAGYQRHGGFPSGDKLAHLARNRGINITDVVDTSKDATGLDDIGDPVEFMEGKVKELREAGTEIPPGLYVVEDSIILIDAQGNVKRRPVT